MRWEKIHAMTRRGETKQRGRFWACHQLELHIQNARQGRRSEWKKSEGNAKKAALKGGKRRSVIDLAKISWSFEFSHLYSPDLNWHPADKEVLQSSNATLAGKGFPHMKMSICLFSSLQMWVLSKRNFPQWK